MKPALFMLVLLALLAMACPHHGRASNWDKPNVPDAGPELRWGE